MKHKLLWNSVEKTNRLLYNAYISVCGGFMYSNIWYDIILLNLKDFPNIGIDFYFNIFVFALAVCLCVIAFVFELNRGAMSLMIKQLFRHEATSADSGKTLGELGLAGKSIIKYSLCHKSPLSKIVQRVGAPTFSYEEYVKLPPAKRRELEKFDIETARFYITEESNERAKKIYSSYGFSVPRIILFCLFILLFAVLIAIFSYEIICLINSALGNI